MKNTENNVLTRRASLCRTFVAMLLASALPACSESLRAADADSELSKNQSGASIILHGEPKANPENSVVKLFATVRRPDPTKPWTKEAPAEVTGSGVVIEGKRILTCAHVVLYASQIEVQASQSGDKLSATVEAMAPGMDLAVLRLDDQSFFKTHPPLPRATPLPELRDAVMVYGFPKGGASLSITKGIVSRIEFVPFNRVSGLRIQIDAAINPGNSGGPVLAGDKMIGLAFSHLLEAENISYAVPSEEINLFLADVADGHYDGKPAMYDCTQTLENPALRNFLKLSSSMHGAVVSQPCSTNAEYPLKRWDVITKIGDSPVDDQGMISLGSNLRVHFKYLVQKIAKDGKVPLTVIRAGKAGKELRIELPIGPKRLPVMPDLDGAYPSYFICGPLSFSTANTEVVRLFSNDPKGGRFLTTLAFGGSPLVTRLGTGQTQPEEGLVVVSSPFFPHKLCKGYDNPMLRVVRTVNGVRIRNLGHLVEVLRDSADEFVTIDFMLRGAETLVFSRQELIASTNDILADNGVRSQGSPDMLAIWNARSKSSTELTQAGN